MNNGKPTQPHFSLGQIVATPQALYERPVNEFVAGFIGSPSINMVEAKLESSNGALAVSFGGHRLAVADELVRAHSSLEDYVGRSIVLGVRPENIEDASLSSAAPQDRRLTVTCDYTEPLGAEVLVYFTVAAVGVVAGGAQEVDPALHRPGGGPATEGTRLVARVDPRTRIAERTRIELAVDTARLYFFDPETREAL